MERGLAIFNPWVDSCSLPSDTTRTRVQIMYMHIIMQLSILLSDTEYRAMSNFKKHLELRHDYYTLLRMAKSSLNKCGPS